MCIYQASTWISNIIRHGLLLCSVVWGDRWLYIMLILVELNNWPLMCVNMLISWGEPLHDRLPVGGCSLCYDKCDNIIYYQECVLLIMFHLVFFWLALYVICHKSLLIYLAIKFDLNWLRIIKKQHVFLSELATILNYTFHHLFEEDIQASYLPYKIW